MSFITQSNLFFQLILFGLLWTSFDRFPVAMADDSATSPGAAPVLGAVGSLCGLCDKPITKSDRDTVVARKMTLGFCLRDSYALRSFTQCCKAQSTEAQMEKLRRDNFDLWKSTVCAFRDQRGSGKETRFDVLKHVESVKKSFIQDSDDAFRPLLFSQYVQHYTSLPQPLTLSEQQAVAKWRADLQNPNVKKSEKKYMNHKSRQEEVICLTLFSSFFSIIIDS